MALRPSSWCVHTQGTTLGRRMSRRAERRAHRDRLKNIWARRSATWTCWKTPSQASLAPQHQVSVCISRHLPRDEKGGGGTSGLRPRRRRWGRLPAEQTKKAVSQHADNTSPKLQKADLLVWFVSRLSLSFKYV